MLCLAVEKSNTHYQLHGPGCVILRENHLMSCRGKPRATSYLSINCCSFNCFAENQRNEQNSTVIRLIERFQTKEATVWEFPRWTDLSWILFRPKVAGRYNDQLLLLRFTSNNLLMSRMSRVFWRPSYVLFPVVIIIIIIMRVWATSTRNSLPLSRCFFSNTLSFRCPVLPDDSALA